MMNHYSTFRFIDDFYEINNFTPTEVDDLKQAIFCMELPTQAQYETHLANAGFQFQVCLIDNENYDR